MKRGAILYSTCDEDSWSELDALDIGSEDTVLSVTGSGCRSLNLLLGAPRRIVSVDANPLQNYLLELKIAAIRDCGHDEFVRFMGVRAADPAWRIGRYRAIRADLSASAQRFWDLNEHVIGRGVIYSGAHERFYARYIGPLVRLLRRRALYRLYSFEGLAEQADFYDRYWNHAGWRTAVRLLARPSLIRLLLGDPSYFHQITRSVSMGDYLLERLRNNFHRHLARDNHLFTLLVFGEYLHEHAVPPYLSPRYYDMIRRNIDAVEVVTARVDLHLRDQRSSTFDKFSLSDISGWTTEEQFTDVLSEVARCTTPGGRVCYRNLFTERPVPEALGTTMRSIPEMADRLTADDIAFAFTLVVAERPAAD